MTDRDLHDVFHKSVGEGWSRYWLTLDEAMAMVGASWVDGAERHITYDPTVKKQYRIVRKTGHDGTLMFTRSMFKEAMLPLLCRTSFYKPEPRPDGCEPFYTVGRIRHAVAYGRVWLRCSTEHKYPGLVESLTIPVRVEWRKVRELEPA